MTKKLNWVTSMYLLDNIWYTMKEDKGQGGEEGEGRWGGGTGGGGEGENERNKEKCLKRQNNNKISSEKKLERNLPIIKLFKVKRMADEGRHKCEELCFLYSFKENYHLFLLLNPPSPNIFKALLWSSNFSFFFRAENTSLKRKLANNFSVLRNLEILKDRKSRLASHEFTKIM